MAPVKMPTVMPSQHNFSMVPKATIERSVFDRSHGYKTTFNAGYLVPIFVDEVLPGDTFSLQAHLLCRLSTPIKPVMDNMFVESFWFFVPYRLVWTNFVKFMGEQEPSTFTVYTIPQCTPPAAGYAIGCLQDYMGIPTEIACTAGTWSHSALPVRAFHRIYNEWFRDENLVASVAISSGDGPDVVPGTGYVLRKRGKRHDYFTSCLPWTQKAANPVNVGLLPTYAPVYTTTGAAALGVGVTQAAAGTPKFLNDVGASNIQATAVSGGAPLLTDLTNETFTINALRQAFQIQRFLERDARGGTRYTEKVRAHFGVVSPDARLQRSEYLGGGSSPMNVQVVAQSAPMAVGSAAPNDTTMGSLSGFGTAFAQGHGFSKSFTEHGVVIGIVNVRADLTYAQGMERFWNRSTIYDFYWPAFAHLGEQAVLNKEIFLADNLAQNNAAFGYQERFAEYRYKPSRVTGLFRPYVTGTLSVWNLSEDFGALPTLASTFIEDQTSTVLDRVLAVNTEPDIIMDAYIQLKCARPMPVYGVPGLIDHF